MTRTFIALEMNQDQQRHLTEVIRQVTRVLPDVHFVDPAGIHLTLAFLGELNDEQLAQATEATAWAAQQSLPYSYRLSRIGTFGSSQSPRVIWIGIEEPTGALLRLHRIVNQQLELRGFATDKRPFSPHLTLARVKRPLSPLEQQHLQELLAGKQATITSSAIYSVRALNVMKSELLRTGAHYTVLRACPLKNC
ncbi:MAG TPA: RNA 2',3'-cyclic phosphodiesterase [Ktedonobacteraceae bacterium]|jgi:2'-5' RNA ligase